MIRVRIDRLLAINVSGYDLEALVLGPGEYEVPPVVAEFLAANPEYGAAIDNLIPSPSPESEAAVPPAAEDPGGEPGSEKEEPPPKRRR